MFSEGKGKKFITLKEASKFSGYTSDHLARLVRNLEIRGKRVGRIWLITREDLEAYLLSQNRDGAHAKRGFINLKDASMLSGYTRDHIARIIRNEEEFNQTREYILYNPLLLSQKSGELWK